MTTAAPEKTTVDPAFQPLHEQIEAAMERHHVPGAAVGIIHEGKEHVAGFGVTNVNHPSPVTPDTLFQIGSTSKTFTATVAMRLVEMGKLDLNAPIRTYLPDFRMADESVAAEVKMLDLLTHVAGWLGDFFEDTGRGDEALAKFVVMMAELPQLTPRGAIWSYNNAAFSLAGRVIEAIMEKPYELVMREMLLDPLGLDHSFFFPEEVMVHSFAVGHNVVEDTPRVATPWPIPRSSNPAGAIAASIRDQLTYARFHMGDGTAPDGTRLLSRESLQRMQTPIIPANEGASMGISWFIRDVDGVKIVQHGGGTNGQISAFMFAPERGFALALPTNANRGGLMNDEVVKWALREYLGIEEPEPVHVERTPEELAEYAGRYEAGLTGVDLTPDPEGAPGGLMLKMELIGKALSDEPPPPMPPAPAAFYEEDKIVVLDGPYKDARGEFLRNPDGSLAWLRLGARIHKRIQ